MNTHKFRRHYPWITLLALVVLVGLAAPNFLRPENLVEIAGDVSTLFIMALGITFVIYIGSIDLSAQSIANMTTVLATLLLARFGVFAAVICIAVGALFGVVSGYVSTSLKVPSFIATLAVGGVALSVGQYVSGQRALYMDAALREQAFGWMTGTLGGVPRAS